MERWSIEVHKDYLKFSAAHFLIFPDGTAERLHGHNYKVYVAVQSGLDGHGLVLNFKQIKPLVRTLCDELDERLLIPGQHAELTHRIATDSGQIEIRYRDRHYSIPAEDVLVLPINNTSAENLAGWIGREIQRRIGEQFPSVRLEELRVGVEETPGQRGVFVWRPDD